MSYNSWLYVYANPVNNTDPSGFVPLPCSESKEIQDTTVNRYCVLDKGGFLDVDHFRYKKDRAISIVEKELFQQFGKRFGKIPFHNSLGGGVPIFSDATYLTWLPAQGLEREELRRITMSIMMDYEHEFEADQSIGCYPLLNLVLHCSSFSNEDLRSDYLGILSGITPDLPLERIVEVLGGGKQASSPPAEYLGNPGDAIKCRDGLCSVETPFNDQCTLKIFDPSTKTYNNMPWPSTWIVEPFGFGVYWGKSIYDFHS